MADRKTKTSASGAQFYQSDANKKARLAAKGTRTDLEKDLYDATSKKMYAGEMTPEQAGDMRAKVFIDSVFDAVKNPPKASGTGRAVMKGRGGSFKGVR